MKKIIAAFLVLIRIFPLVFAHDGTIGLAGWLESDIGAVGGAGTSVVSSGTFTFTDRGAQVWGKADSGRYVYKHGDGNGTLTARVVSMAAPSDNAQACVMIRETLLPGSKMAALCATPKKGLQFITRQYNEHPYQDTASFDYGGAAPSIYLHLILVRSALGGVTITAEYSFNGILWRQIGSPTRITMLGTGYTYGMFSSSHDTGTLRTAVFDSAATTIPANGLHYYASPTASGSGDGSFATPWTIKQALATNAGSIAAGSTVWLRGGIYTLKNFTATLAGNSGARTVVRSYPGEQAKIDGGWFTTLSPIASTGCTITVNDTSYVPSGTVLHVISRSTTGAEKREDINIVNISGSTVTGCVRGWNGTTAQAHDTQVRGIVPGAVIYLSGIYVDWYDIEIYNSEPNRVGSGYPYSSDGDNQNWPALRGPGMAVNAANIRTLFMVTHDNSDGINAFNNAVAHLWYGCQTYNNGTGFGAVNDRGNGHGIYIQNQAGTTRTYQYSVSANNFATAFKFGAVSGWVQDITADHLIGQHGGAQGGRGTKYHTSENVLEFVADSTPMSNITLDNLTAFGRFAGGDVNLLFGYTAANNKNGTATNNYLVGSGQGVSWRNWQSGTFSNNFVYITNGDSSSDTQMVAFTYGTQGAYSGTVDTSGTTVTRVNGDPFNYSWGTGCTGCPSTITINGTNRTIVSVNDAGTVMTVSPSPGTLSGVTYSVSTSTESHPLAGQVTFNNNTYYSGVQLDGYITVPPSNVRYQYQYTASEPGQTFVNEFGASRGQFSVAGSPNDWKEWLASRSVVSSESGSTWTLGKPSGTVIKFNPTITFESARGWVAYIGVVNWDELSAVTIPATSLNNVLAVGDRYQVWKLENACGSPTFTGVYGGSDISIPTTDRAVCQALNVPFVHYSGWINRYNTLMIRRL